MDMNTHAYTKAHRIHSCKHTQTKKILISAEAKGYHRQLTPTGHSQTQILELKGTTTFAIIKAKERTQTSH